MLRQYVRELKDWLNEEETSLLEDVGESAAIIKENGR
jgi:hypothetical protein